MDRRPVTLRGLEISNKIHSTSIFKLQFMHLTPGPIKVLCGHKIFKFLLSNSLYEWSLAGPFQLFCEKSAQQWPFFKTMLLCFFLSVHTVPINIFSVLIFLVLVSLSCIFVILHYLLYVSSLRTALAIRKMPNRLLNFYVKWKGLLYNPF